MYIPYDAIARLNEAALRHCEVRYLDPDSDYDNHDCYADDEEEADDAPC